MVQEKKKIVLIMPQYNFPQIQIWPDTKNMQRMCGH